VVLTALYQTLNPVQLKRDIARCQDPLLETSALKPARGPVDRRWSTPSNPPWKRTHARWLAVPQADFSSDATNEAARTS
jgi:hypothetical protein